MTERSSRLRIVDGPPPPTTDEALAIALIAGEPWAARETWDRFAPMVNRLLRHALGSAVDAEDATQDVFARVFSKVSGLKEPSAIRSFVYSIAVRVLGRQLRRRWIRRIMHLSDPFSLPEPPGPVPDPQARAALVRLYNYLDRLSIEDRTVFVLRRVDGLTLNEVAGALNVSVATAKRRISRASGRMHALSRNDPFLSAYLELADSEKP